MKSKFVSLIIIAVMVVAVVFFVIPGSSTPPLQPQAAQTGITVKGCFLSPSGEQFGCNESKKVPVALNSVNAGGRDIAAITLPSAYGSFNHTGDIESWRFTAKEVSDSGNYSVSLSAVGNPPEKWNFTLPKSSWSESELAAMWGSNYGEKVFKVSLINPTLVVKFANGNNVTAPSEFNYVVEFKLDYSAPSTSTTTTSTGTYTTTTTVTETSTTTMESGSVSSGTEEAWATTTEAATGGKTGNTSPDGVIMTRSSSTTDYSWTSVWVFIPDGFLAGKGWTCSGSLDGMGCFFVNVVSRDVSVSVGPYWFKDNNWYSIKVPIGAADDATILIINGYVPDRKVTDNFVILFEQVVPRSSPTLNDSPPSPFDSSYEAWLGVQAPAATTTTTTTTTQTPFCYRPNGDPEYIESRCILYSVVTVKF